MTTDKDLSDLQLARRVLHTEAEAIVGLVERLDARFTTAVSLLVECRGRVIVTGMGKSGLICRKVAATLSSTGTPAFFLHPAEAIHGDLGAIQPDDVVVALSYSGETAELLRLLETIRRIGAHLVAITGDVSSTLAQSADVAIDARVVEEACPLNLAPTASTTAALALGDALAMVVATRKGFQQEDFAHLHPGGKLGRRFLRVEQLMHGGDGLPLVSPATGMRDVIYEMSRKQLGMTCVVDRDCRLVGIITDGDLRRHMADPGILDRRAEEVMTTGPTTIAPGELAVEALNVMERRKITSLPVVGERQTLEGVVHLHDLWRTQLI